MREIAGNTIIRNDETRDSVAHRLQSDAQARRPRERRKADRTPQVGQNGEIVDKHVRHDQRNAKLHKDGRGER